MKRPSTAVQAALTGHLLISTLHANDAIGAVARLDDLGVDNFKIGGALLGSVAQRLLRQICPRVQGAGRAERIAAQDAVQRPQACRRTRCSTAAAAARSASAPATRAGFRFTKSWSSRRRWPKAIENGLPRDEASRRSRLSEGMVELAAAGMEQVLAGRTTLEEVFYKLSS